jgi:hypothetical protein
LVLKERTIGVEVFGRPPTYDPGNDSTVRVKAGEVRKRLQMYYSGSGAGSEIHIDLPAGGYTPEFRRVPVPPAERPVSTVPVPIHKSVRWAWASFGAILLLAVVAGVLLLSYRAPAKPDPVMLQFWGPALGSNSQILFCVSYVPVYGLDPRLESRGERPKKIEDFTLQSQDFVGGGDMLATSALSRLFAGLGRDYRIKLGSDVSFHDLQSSPAVLIGYSYTRWGPLLRGMRYLFDTNPDSLGITDNGKPTPWALRAMPADRRVDEDYAIACRLFHPDTGTLIVVLSGITQYGTEAAADLVTSPARLQEAVRNLPADWAKHNLQLVLHTRVISGEAATAKVVATYVW